MKRNKKALLSVVAMFTFFIMLATNMPLLTANAAEKEIPVSTIVDDIHWVKQGSQDVYSRNESKSYYTTGADSAISSVPTVKGSETVYAEFWIKNAADLSAETQFIFQPYSLVQNGATDVIYITTSLSTCLYTSTGNFANWTGEWDAPASWDSPTNGWNAPLSAMGNSGWERAPKYLTGVRFVGRPDGSTSFYLWEQDEANRSAEYAWRERYRTLPVGENKNYYPAPDASVDYHTLIQIKGACDIEKISFGTVVESSEDFAGRILSDKSVLTEIAGTETMLVKQGVSMDLATATNIYATSGSFTTLGTPSYKTNPNANLMPNVNHISTADTVKGDKAVYVKFNLKSFAATAAFAFQPYNTATNSITDIIYTTAERTIPQYSSTGNVAAWTAEWAWDCASGWGANMSAMGNSGWERAPKYVTEVMYVGRPDGSVSFYLWEQDEANRTTDMAWRERYRTSQEAGKNYYPIPDANGDYHITLSIGGEAEIDKIEFGTLEESADDLAARLITEKSTLTKVVGTSDMSDGVFGMTAAPGKIVASSGTVVTNNETVIANPTKDDILYAALPVYADPITDNVFDLTATMSIDTLSAGRKVGVGVTQLAADEINVNPVDAEGSSFIYFEKVDGANVIGLMNGGEVVKTCPVTTDLSATFALNLHATKDGKIVAKVGAETFEFEGAAIDGYIAISSIGEGDVKYLIDPNVSIIRYSYLSSETGDIECNFNEYVDPNNIFINTTSTTGFANIQQAIGVEQAEDGTIFFNGSGTNSVLCPGGMYADFVLEFDYTSIPMEERPVKAAGWMFGYSDMSIAFGNETPFGWGRGAYQLFVRDYATRQWVTADEPYQGYASVKLHDWMDNKILGDGEIFIADGAHTVDETTGVASYTQTAKDGYIALYAQTTRFKLVVADNVATLYGCTMIEGKALSEYTAADYVILGSWDLPESLAGRVSICADENAFFKIDNLRITRLDGDKVSDVQENLAAYVDFKEIADDPRPTVLAKPALTVEGKVVSWTAVEGATAYAVSVNGGEDTVIYETSYTLTETADGEYEIAIKALGDGGKLLDSGYARETIVIGAGGGDSSSSSDSVSGSSSVPYTGCLGSVSLTSVAMFALVIGTVAIVRKKKED